MVILAGEREMPESLGGEGFRVFTSIYYNLGNCLLNYGRDCHFLNPESLGGEGLRAIPHFEGSFGVICEGFPPLFESNGCSVGWRGGEGIISYPRHRGDGCNYDKMMLIMYREPELSVPLSSGRWLQPPV